MNQRVFVLTLDTRFDSFLTFLLIKGVPSGQRTWSGVGRQVWSVKYAKAPFGIKVYFKTVP